MGDSEDKFPLILNLTLDIEDFQGGAIKILHHVRPLWTEGDVKMKVFTKGITNKILGYYHRGDESDIVLIRINGINTETIIDRAKEIVNFKTLLNAGCAPDLYCIFNNGLCYRYIAGETITKDEVRNPAIYELIAKEVARVHKIPLPQSQPLRPRKLESGGKYLDVIFSPDSPPGRGLVGYTGPTEKELRDELEVLKEHISKLDSPVVFCHNDLLLNNIIYNKEKHSVHFIDYEYAGVNFQASEIGTHFCEFAGVGDFDSSLYPNRELQCDWIRQYLKHWKGGKEITDKEVEILYVQVNKFALLSHFGMGLWALTQVKYSTLDFDYVKFAHDRFGEYFRRKDEFLALKMP